MDVVLAVVIFGFISVTFTSFALLDQPDVQRLQQNAQKVTTELSQPLSQCGGVSILTDNALDQEGTDCLYQQDYQEIKQQFNIEEDFCMYLEDEDGNIVQVAGKNGFGSDEVNISGAPCGQ